MRSDAVAYDDQKLTIMVKEPVYIVIFITTKNISEAKRISQKLIDECHKIYKDNFQKEFPEYFEHNYTKVASVITILENNEIKQIGMSKINDLLTDNYGIWFGQFIFPTVNFNMIDINSVNRAVRSWSTSGASSVWNQTVVVVGTLIKVGSGLANATRQDVNLQALLQQLLSGNGGYNSGLGKVDIPATIASSFDGTINEVGLFGRWNVNGFGAQQFLISRDNVSSVAVTIGQTINVDYQIILS